MNLPCRTCPVLGIDQIAKDESSDDPLIRSAAYVASEILELGNRNERGPMYAGIEVDPVTGEDLGPRFECCNRNASLAATVVSAAILASTNVL